MLTRLSARKLTAGNKVVLWIRLLSVPDYADEAVLERRILLTRTLSISVISVCLWDPDPDSVTVLLDPGPS